LGGFIGAVGWPQKMMSAVLLPLVLMFFLRVVRGENALANAAASGALLGASFLSGHHDVPIFFTLVMTGLWIYHLASVRWRAVVPGAAFSACFLLIAAAQILPAVELGRLSLRWVNAPSPVSWAERIPYSVHEGFSLYPTAILGIVIPGFQHDSAVFIGLVAFTLALVGAAARWHDRMVRILATVALSGLVLALGGFSLMHGILYALVPSLDKVRSPSMAEAIFHLGLIGLAAYGVDSFSDPLLSRRAKRLAVRLLGLVGLFLCAGLIVLITVRAEQSEEYKMLALAALVAIVLAGLLHAWRRARLSNRMAGVLVIGLLLFELNNVSNYAYRPLSAANNLKLPGEHRDLAEFLKQAGNMTRVDVDRGEVPYNFGDWFGVDELGGFLPAAPKSIAEMQGDPRYRSLLAVGYYLGRKAANPDQAVVFQGQSGLKLFANPGAMPRARIVHGVVSAPDEAGVVSAVLNPANDLKRTAVLQGDSPAIESCDGGTVEVRRYRPTSVVLHTTSPCRAMVVFADVWFPGWRASVDGRSSRIYAAYNMLRGVVVDGGEHDVVLVYRPTSVFTGVVLALGGIALCVALQFVKGSTLRGPKNR
jgi:hypothetical protein